MHKILDHTGMAGTILLIVYLTTTFTDKFGPPSLTIGLISAYLLYFWVWYQAWLKRKGKEHRSKYALIEATILPNILFVVTLVAMFYNHVLK